MGALRKSNTRYFRNRSCGSRVFPLSVKADVKETVQPSFQYESLDDILVIYMIVSEGPTFRYSLCLGQAKCIFKSCFR